MDNPRYPALSTIANVYRILAWITIVLTLFATVVGVVSAFTTNTYIGGGFMQFLETFLGAILGSIVIAMVYGVIGLVIALLQLAVAELLQVVMDIESNTRQGSSQ